VPNGAIAGYDHADGSRILFILKGFLNWIHWSAKCPSLGEFYIQLFFWGMDMQNCTERITTVTDSQLVDAARRGNRNAFDELIGRHRKQCVSMAASMLRDTGEAEEEAQNACWKAFAHLDQFHGDSEFSSWLFRILKNQCLMVIRRRRGVQLLHMDDRRPDDGSEPMQLSSHELSPEDEVSGREVIHVLRMEINCMPRLLRNVLLLRDVERQPMPEIAGRLGITVTAAKSRLLRARLELRQRMKGHCGRSGFGSLLTNGSRGWSTKVR
jgi:RNA polymerase sigma-70 factor (ECF subfamily)